MSTNPRYLILFSLMFLTLMVAGPALAQDPSFKMLIGSDVYDALDHVHSPTGLAIHNGELYVVEASDKEVSVFTLAGVYQRKFGPLGSAPEKIAIDTAGNCYITDSVDHNVMKFDATGAFVTEWGGRGSGDGQLNTPLGITFDGDGNLWVNDRFNYRFVKYDTDGNQLSATTRNTQDNSGATDIVFGNDGMIYATMWAPGSERVNVFDTSGTLLRYSTTMQGPQGIGLAPNGMIGVVGWNTHQAFILEADDPMANVATWGSLGSDPEQFDYPKDIVFDDTGDIFICDRSLAIVKVFTSLLVPETKASLGSVKAMFR